MLVISLFSGIGGFEEAATQVGWDIGVSCEINPFGSHVLKDEYPHAYHHDDIHTLTHEKIEKELSKRFGSKWRANGTVLVGGFPCQPYSLAGKRLGTDDDRHLWPEMLRIIQEVQPDWIVGENVFGLINWNGGMVFNEVQADLEAAGYEVQSYVLPACAVNAPHRRDRVWIVAHRHGERWNDWSDNWQERSVYNNKERNAEKNQSEWSERKCWTGEIGSNCTKQTPIHSISKHDGGHNSGTSSGARLDMDGYSMDETERNESSDNIESSGTVFGDAADTDSAPLEHRNGQTEKERENQRGRTEPLGGNNHWSNFPTQPPIRSGNDGFSTESLRQWFDKNSGGLLTEKEIDTLVQRTINKWAEETIKAAGNAIVPQVALQIFKSIQKYA